MTDHRENVWLRLGAVMLAILTLAAVIFAIINFQQRLLFDAQHARRCLRETSEVADENAYFPLTTNANRGATKATIGSAGAAHCNAMR